MVNLLARIPEHLIYYGFVWGILLSPVYICVFVCTFIYALDKVRKKKSRKN